MKDNTNTKFFFPQEKNLKFKKNSMDLKHFLAS